MVQTRSAAKAMVKGNENEGKTVAERELEPPPAPTDPRASSATAPPAPSRPASIASTRSSATVVARRLAAEALHARRLAELERERLAAEEQRISLEREAAQLELRAEIAAIEADASQRSSRSSHHVVAQWLSKSEADGNCNTTLKCNNDYRQADPEAQVAPIARTATAPQAPGAAPASARNENSAEVPQLIKSLEVLIHNVNKGNSPGIQNVPLPRFDGKSHLDWLSLKRAFLDTQGSYSAANNLARLNAALSGCAREAVAALLVSAREPGAVLLALDARFGRPELVVAHEVAAVRALPRVSGEGRDLAIFASRVRNCVEVIRLLDHTEYLASPELFQAVITKISPLLRAKWLDFAARYEAGGQSKLEILADFLAHEIDLQARFGIIAEPATASHAADGRRPRDHVHAVAENYHAVTNSAPHITSNSSATARRNNICIVCQQSHQLIDCDKFMSMSFDERWKLIKKKRVCHRCLKVGWHRLNLCKAKRSCDINGCAFRHHALLHNPNYERTAAAHVDVDDDEPAPGPSRAPPSAASVSNSPALSLAPAPGDVAPKEILTHASTSTTSENSPNVCLPRPLLKIVAVTVSGPAGSVDTYALLDDGSTATFIDAEIAKKLGVCGPEKQIRLNCVGGLSKDTVIQYVDFQIKGRRTEESYTIRKARAIAGLCAAGQTIDKASVSKYHYLSDIVDDFCYGEVKPTIIIGIDNWHLSMSRVTRKGTKNQPVAICTALGWALFGFGCSRTVAVDTVNHTTMSESSAADISDRTVLDQLVREQYYLDSIGISKREPRSADDERAIQILERTTRRLPGGRFEVGLIWKSDNLLVPDSYKLALSRFLSLERKMSRDRDYAERYRQNIHDMIRKGYAELCSEVHSAKSPIWHLPHFGVINPNKPNKLRVVHDAAAKSNDVSLNSLLLTGPDLLQPLLGILLRFREGQVALTGDIREMFPQIKIRIEDRDAQRFLWRDSPNEPLKTYRMSSMIFGAASSPFTAIYIKNKNAVEWQERYPDAARAIVVDHYMDDCILSLDSVDEAAKLAAEIHAIHRHAGFDMRAWASNNLSALSLLPKESLLEVPVASKDVDVDLGHLTTPVRTLGLIWQPIADTIGFNTGLKAESALPNKLTKREVLAHVMRVFDPLGILAPIVVTGRIMFQDAWRKGLDWDEELSQSDSAAWRLWFEDLFAVSHLQIPRCYCPGELRIAKCELHIFCDASEAAFAAVAYWRFIIENGNVKLALICSKVRVAPIKPVSINRLELQGALIAARLAAAICQAHRHQPVKRIFWCDSMTVLGWLRSEARSFKPFVSHRIGEILETTDVKEWRWLPSNLNVADDATRIKRTTLSLESRWISGPEFLLSFEWPKEPSVPVYPGLEKESKRAVRSDLVHLISDVEKHEPVSADPKRFSSWLRLVRATANAHKYLTLLRVRSLMKRGLRVDNLVRFEGGLCTFTFQPTDQLSALANSAPSRESARELTAADIRLAETHILRQAQLGLFSDEMRHLASHPEQPLPRTSRLSKLSVFVDNEGLMRLSGRISAALEIRAETKSPIVLDGRHPAVRLLVHHCHRRAAHANTETVVNELRQDYYLLSLRSIVRTVAFHCQFCRIRRAVNFQPPIGDLPEARLAHHRRAFTFSGLDYFGPLQVSVGRRREKRYVALYTCLASRAIHLEVVHSLSADSAVMSLRRFAALRGTPTEIWSDNGTAFVGANRELRALYDDAVPRYASTEKINWRFIPPGAPFMGGSWERMIRSVKVALRVTLTERAPTDEVLRTLLAEVEALVNSRPLTHVPTEPGSEEALTPMHFILNSSSGRPVPATLSDSDLSSRSGWRRAVRLADHFWRRWVQEYLPTLIPRRGRGEAPDISIGDLVMIVDGNMPRGAWPRGRITATFPGRDGIVRVADVTTSAGVFRRPLRKLVKLS